MARQWWQFAAVVVTMFGLLFYLKCCPQSTISSNRIEENQNHTTQQPFYNYTLETENNHTVPTTTCITHVEHHDEPEKEINRTRYILLYTSFYEDAKWALPSVTVGTDYFKAKRCPVTNCVMTTDHGLVKPITEYDALVYHAARRWKVKPPRERMARQIYIAAIWESPAHTEHPLGPETNSFFNWTMTYRLDSDILFYYGNIVDLESGEVVSPALKPIWRYGFNAYNNATLVKLISQKQVMAAQFVSHCGAVSKRDQLVRSLQDAGLKVDVYGACGKYTCYHNSPECGQKLDKVYWFYLSFENSLYVDYVTEKLYNALEHNVVPIVYGGANYSRFAPPGSYIDVQDFGSAKQLVEYLQYLIKNPQEYVKYFWWKQHYAIDHSSSVWCQVCEQLHDVSTSTAVQYYRSIHSWWHDNASTAKQKLKF